jgi:hypothetical protein
MGEQQDFLKDVLLRCPITGEPQKIVSVRAAGEGLDHMEIVTKGESTGWKHRVYSEEV